MNTENSLFGFEIAHFKWLSYECKAEPICFATLSDFKKAPKALIRAELAPEASVSFTILKEKHCIGYPDTEDNIIPCETNARVTKGNQCGVCIGKDTLSKCTYCKGECSSTGTPVYCETTPHLVYLAAFTGDFVKVGTTAEKRLKTRLLEQGANYVRVIARTPSQGLAKRVEEYLKITFSIPDKRNKKIKQESLNPDFMVSDFVSVLNKKVLEISKDQSEFSKFFVQNNGDLDFYSSYSDLLRRKEITKINFIEAKKGEDICVEGKIVSPKGDFLIINDRESIFAVNIGAKVGSLLTNGTSKDKTQLKLF